MEKYKYKLFFFHCDPPQEIDGIDNGWMESSVTLFFSPARSVSFSALLFFVVMRPTCEQKQQFWISFTLFIKDIFILTV